MNANLTIKNASSVDQRAAAAFKNAFEAAQLGESVLRRAGPIGCESERSAAGRTEVRGRATDGVSSSAASQRRNNKAPSAAAPAADWQTLRSLLLSDRTGQ